MSVAPEQERNRAATWVCYRRSALRILFSVTALFGAFLLFLVEPMFARMVLPLLGGAPAVWNTCLVFYQCALLVGYLYVHSVRQRALRLQVLLQFGLLALAGIALPIAVRGGGAPPASANPVGWVLWILIVSLGLPFIVLATTGPLLQRWFSLLSDSTKGSPYSLFAASNIGSFVALLGYPMVVEPTLRIHTQSVGWTVGFGVYALLMAACGAAVWRGGAVAQRDMSPATPTPVTSSPASRRRQEKAPAPVDRADDPWEARLRWLGLAAVPATLMMSVTTFIATDVASVPLLWMAPLAIYLLTFVLAFAERPLVRRDLIVWLFPVAVVLIVGLVMAPPVFPGVMIGLHLTAFFLIAMACHLELASSRPPAESLTEFYLWLSAGGAVGGLFNALVAPLIFVNPFEYPLAALSACLLLPHAVGDGAAVRSRLRQIAGLAMTVVPLLLVGAGLWFVQTMDARLTYDTFTRYAIIFGPPCLVGFLMRSSPLRMGIALAIVVVAGAFIRFDNRVPIHLERSFFGVHRVLFSGGERVLLSGTTNHGAQSVDPSLKCEPLTYYSRGGPIGQLFSALKAQGKLGRVGVVGLGTASLAAYASPGQSWTFFEINPVVERLARESFTFLRDCAPDAKVIIGDARLKLGSQPEGAFDVLVLDAFSSDSIPVHLMTREAMELYFHTLAPGGVLAVHVSNRFLDLAPVVAATGRSAGFKSVEQLHAPSEDQSAISREISPSRWVLVVRGLADLGALATDSRWRSLDAADGPVWTDDYSNVVGVLKR
ncbi:MAG: fused MFS/spermidine synthase [Vicinamibacterales bacterium]